MEGVAGRSVRDLDALNKRLPPVDQVFHSLLLAFGAVDNYQRLLIQDPPKRNDECIPMLAQRAIHAKGASYVTSTRREPVAQNDPALGFAAIQQKPSLIYIQTLIISAVTL
jgi:hypothetical protein